MSCESPDPTTAALDDTDQAVLDQVRGLFAHLDPVPADLVARTQFAITLDALHAEVAELQRVGLDSELSGTARAEVPAGVETITFASSTLTTMVTVSPAAPGAVRVDGWAVPGAGLAVELRRPDGSRHTVADDDGRFVFDEVPKGLAQFVLRPADGTAVITPSLQL